MDWITSVFHMWVQVLTAHLDQKQTFTMNKAPVKSVREWVFFWPPMNAHFPFNELNSKFVFKIRSAH